MRPKSLTLSVCVIARDAASSISRCLESVKPIADQIVIVDTGSKDDTIEIAKDHGAEVECFQWCDDFGSARNIALDRASSKWVLSIDTDEWLPEDTQRRLASMKVTEAEPWRWSMQVVAVSGLACARFRNISSDANHETEAEIVTSMTGPRLFPRIGTRWRMRIHEFPENDRFKVINNPLIRILHDGYESFNAEKEQRNLRILRAGIDTASVEADICHYSFHLARYTSAISGLSTVERKVLLARCIQGGRPGIRCEAGDVLTDIYWQGNNWKAILDTCSKLGDLTSPYARCAEVTSLIELGNVKAAREKFKRVLKMPIHSHLGEPEAVISRIRLLAGKPELKSL